MQGISLSPSFSSYSNSKIAEIAARIVAESDPDEFSGFENPKNSADERGFSDEEFEFSMVTTDSELPLPNSADEIFQNGKIRPVYPVFNRDLLLGHVNFHGGNEEENGFRNSVSPSPKIRLPLRKLFLEERETTLTTSSSSSSESDNLDGLTGESYCAWPPKEDLRSEKKSSSAGGNSKRSKLRDFLRRSNSDGIKTSSIFQFHSNNGKKKEIKKKVTETPVESGKVKSAAADPLPPPLYSWNGGDKQRSNLTQRQDLAGLFAV